MGGYGNRDKTNRVGRVVKGLVVYISKSGLGSFLWCPLKFKYQVIDRIPMNSNVVMMIGTMFHDFADDFFKRMDYDKLAMIEEYVPAYRLMMGYIPNDTPILVRPFCETFVEFEARRWEHAFDMFQEEAIEFYQPIDTENKLRSGVEKLSGIIDRVDRLLTGGLVVIEYKTGQSFREDDLRRELAFYTILLTVTNYYDEDEITHWAVYNPRLKKILFEEIKPGVISITWRRIRQLRRAIENEDFPARPGFGCFYCGYADICPEVSPEIREVL